MQVPSNIQTDERTDAGSVKHSIEFNKEHGGPCPPVQSPNNTLDNGSVLLRCIGQEGALNQRPAAASCAQTVAPQPGLCRRPSTSQMAWKQNSISRVAWQDIAEVLHLTIDKAAAKLGLW
jgi:hypothetical protein